jgi:ribosomal protein S18 acetylase RimI-like enzyme
VARAVVRVRVATQADVPTLLSLAGDLREQSLAGESAGRARGGSMAARSQTAARYEAAVNDPARHVVLAVTGTDDAEEVLGMAVFAVGTANALLDVPALQVSHAVVPDRYRRRGAGRALVAAAASYAEERGIEHLVVSVAPASREAARFFARLGFAPLSRRTAPVSVVRRHLASADRTRELPRRRRTSPPPP